MRVAFLITAFNESPDALVATVDHVRRQSFPGPLIVVDDCSSVPIDGIPGVTVLRMARNVGICAARNAGLMALESFDFVGILNCDVLLPPDWAAAMVSVLKVNGRSGCAWTALRAAKDDVSTRWWLDCQEAVSTQQTPVDFAPGHAVMFRREALLAVEGYDSARFQNMNEDWDICRRMSLAGFTTTALAEPRVASLQDTRVHIMAAKDLHRLFYGKETNLGSRLATVVQKVVRRTVRHIVSGRLELLPRDWAVCAMSVWLLGTRHRGRSATNFRP